MTAIKKTTKSKASPAPATKTAPDPKSVAKTKPAAKKAAPITPAQATAGLAAVAAKAVVSTPAATVITARVDVGFGNALFIRGEGPGLSWDKGVAMTCVADDLWRISLTQTPIRPFAVKFLINDSLWSVGPDFTVEPGASVTFAPGF